MAKFVYPDVKVHFLKDGKPWLRFSQYVGHGLYLVHDMDETTGEYEPVYYCGNRYVNYYEVVQLLERMGGYVENL